MSEQVEKWSLRVMLVAGAVSLVGHLFDHDWFRAVLWGSAMVGLCIVFFGRERTGTGEGDRSDITE